MTSRNDLMAQLSDVLAELFEISPDAIKEDSRLYEDLDLDSIDAVDLIVKLQAITGQKIKPEEFKAVRTVGNVLDCLERLLVRDVPA